MNIFNSLLAQLVKYDVHTTRKINSIHAIFYHILSFYSGTNLVEGSTLLGRGIIVRVDAGQPLSTVV